MTGRWLNSPDAGWLDLQALLLPLLEKTTWHHRAQKQLDNILHPTQPQTHETGSAEQPAVHYYLLGSITPQTSMSYWSYWVSRENFRSVTGCDDAGAYWRFEFFWHILLGFCLAGVAALVGVGYAGYRLWTEIALEISYRQKYGASWQAEFERYHGSLAHIHLRLYVVLFCLLALLAVVLWFCRQFLKSHRRPRHDHAA